MTKSAVSGTGGGSRSCDCCCGVWTGSAYGMVTSTAAASGLPSAQIPCGAAHWRTGKRSTMSAGAVGRTLIRQ